MSAAPSSSGAPNGRGGPSNGASSSHATGTSQSSGYDSYGNSDNGSPFSEVGASPEYSQSSYQTHNEDIVNHLYQAGFQTGNYADTILHVHQNSYRLHAIILSRSPFLAHLMSTSPQSGGQHSIFVNLEQEPEVTQEGFAIALGYLYSAVSLGLIRPENARASLAAGCLLGGMDDFCAYAYEACRQSITVDNITEWVNFIDAIPSTSDGSSTPVFSTSTVFGQYAQKMKDDVFYFLVVTLPAVLDAHSPPSTDPTQIKNGRDILLQIYSRVPFDMFKAAMESNLFQVGSDQTRFKFVKDAIEVRKRGIARASGAEETVVLAFGGGNGGGSAVHVTRKMRKRPLWKVSTSS